MDKDTIASTKNASYVNINNFIAKETSTNQWSAMAGSFSTSRETEITLKLSELIVTARISAPFYVITKKFNYNIIFGRDKLWKLGIQLDFQNDFIVWQDINFPMKPIDYKMRTHLTIQGSRNIRSTTKRIKKF